MKADIAQQKRVYAYATQAVIKKWGNSQGIRLSKELLQQMDLRENDTVAINVDGSKMIIEKVAQPKYHNLQERLEQFYNKPIEEIYVDSEPGMDMGDPIGEEQW